METLYKAFFLSLGLGKTVVYATEYNVLYSLSSLLSRFVTPPKIEKDKKLIEHMRKNVLKLLAEDADNIVRNIYPRPKIIPQTIVGHIARFPIVLFDSVKVSRRRKMREIDDLKVEEKVPHYLNRNFHFQTDGYFSNFSASIYEHQVEVLFNGTAQAMRRMLIAHIKKSYNPKRPLKILEIGAGSGAITQDFLNSFNIETYIVTDPSKEYLKEAEKKLKQNLKKNIKKNIKSDKVEFVEAYGESLPFKDNEFDIVFSVYLFHELPRNIRKEVIKESYRVLKKSGVVAICDSLQMDDDSMLNHVLENFPKDYHEPFYRDYINWNATETLKDAGFENIKSDFRLLSKYWVAFKN